MFKKGAFMRFRKANTADLANDLSQLLDDLKEVLASKGHDTDPAASRRFGKAASTLEKVRNASSRAVCESKAAAHSANALVHASPWRAVGGALAVGALIGMVLGRR
ncbi:hypothetical protein [uncultured Comamonas sp.]|jgi:ElaB/YqjD/DUF883 family membrane-anchored ribosome-binding protein|uniref:DUF883 family protein n=2 Tax=Comamonas TaxID=283 RepID=UPI0012C777EC|nr:hypothetical protein [uncultured Comamonas sp.]MPS93305.1 DUF883 family protein [Comamonas sp.]